VSDFTIVKDGSMFLLRANSAAGQEWIDQNVPIASWGSAEINGQTVSPVTFNFRDGAVVVPPCHGTLVSGHQRRGADNQDGGITQSHSSRRGSNRALLPRFIAHVAAGLRFNEHMDETDGPLVFQHACKMGLEGIWSKRRDSSYRSGRSPDWIKSKYPDAPAVKREAEEDWGRPWRA